MYESIQVKSKLALDADVCVGAVSGTIFLLGSV
jgi:hypothetical protein